MTTAPSPPAGARASARDTARVTAQVLLPLVARGLIVRRPWVVAVAERIDADRRAVRLLQSLRSRYGPGPLLLRLPLRSVAVVLSPEHVHRVLDGSPEPFAVATVEKRAALSRFQPHGLLISPADARPDRRRFNEAVLDSGAPVHGMAGDLVAKVREEAGTVIAPAARAGHLGWDDFARAWWRIVRRVVLGDGARTDDAVTDVLAELRAEANWAYLRPPGERRRAAFDRRLRAHLQRAEPGSLAHLVATTPATAQTVPHDQVPQWLFAFDAAGMATFRALALLATHPEQAARARDELAGRDLSQPQDLPHLRACVLESLRLWPTTPGVLRESTVETTWDGGGTLPARTSLLIFAPLFHRDDRRMEHAHRFQPDLWSDPGAAQRWPLIPFSDGPARCAGENLVLLVTSTLLAALLEHHRFRLRSARRLRRRHGLPGTLDPFRLRFDVTA